MRQTQTFTTHSPKETRALAERLARNLKDLSSQRRFSKFLALYGELGSGKTTFIQGLARSLGVKARILSPSFSLIRQYPIPDAKCTFFHVDLYRLNNLQEIKGLGLEEILQNPQNICAVEWAQKAQSLLPKKRWDIYFKYLSDKERQIRIQKSNTEENEIQRAIEILNRGGIVVFPTDTAFGVGCRIDNENAVEKLLKLKKRPEGQAVPVLVDSIEMAQEYLLPFPDKVLKLMRKYWPGGLTIVFPCRIEKVFKKIRGGGKTLGVRWPDHPGIKKIIRGIGVPILGPSANFHGAPTPYRSSDLNPDFLKRVDFVLEDEETHRQKPSTVIDCSQKPWKIIRQGAVQIPKPLLVNN